MNQGHTFQHLVPSLRWGKCELRDVISSFALIEVTLHYFIACPLKPARIAHLTFSLVGQDQ
jgi:hypothetical protein